MPKVSVLMPVYKTDERYLRQAIESILGQTYTDFEFLILDDCPADTREAIVKSYTDPRIRYAINERNMGITPARNKLIDMAQGEYIAPFDHDDISLPTRLEKEVAVLDAHPEIGVVSAWYREIPRNKVRIRPEHDADIRLNLVEHCLVVHSASMLRKSVLDKHNIRYEEEFTPAEDYSLWYRLMGVTQFYTVQEVLFEYRWYSGNTSKAQRDRQSAMGLRIAARIQHDHPELYAEYCARAKYTTVVRLWGIPVLRTERQGEFTKMWLFGVVPLLRIKRTRTCFQQKL